MSEQSRDHEFQGQRKFGWNAYEHQPPFTPRERMFRRMAGIATTLGRLRAGRALLRRVQRWPLTAPAYRGLVGYLRPFASFAEAEAAIAPYVSEARPRETAGATSGSHGLKLAGVLRPSDYPALFHMRSMERELRTVLDLGGNAGNLYYLYARMLNLRPDLRWTVLDLPAIMAVGEEIARERGADALRFTTDWSDAEGVDLLLVSSALHFIGEPLPARLQRLTVKPACILLNCAALKEGPSIATALMMNNFRVAWMLYSREQLLEELAALGYAVLDEWRAPDFSHNVPGYPEHAIPAYRGVLLRLTERGGRDSSEVP